MKEFCQHCLKLFSLKSSLVFFYLLSASQTQAQIVPDATLPNPSIITPDVNATVITGGTQAGSNLFHSFQEFSVPTGSTAYFNNAQTIENIISRVTGKGISNIDGLIRANGTANLFLINPNGIIFGKNASLNIGGSFLATTADSIKFADGTQFSAVQPQTTPLLTVSVPIGLQFGQKPGEISNASLAPLIDFGTGNPVIDQSGKPFDGGLQVPLGKTLALVGGSINFPGGFVTVEGGRIELGSVGGAALVSLIPIGNGWTLGYEGVEKFQDMLFSQSAFLNAQGPGSSNIKIQGGQISLTEASVIGSLASLGDENGGEIQIRASQLNIDDLSLVASFTQGSGKAADITVQTNQLITKNGGQIVSKTYDEGRTGNLTITATDFIEAKGGEIIGGTWYPSGLLTLVESKAAGDGGNLRITTNNLKIVDGAQIVTSTLGSGNAGSIDVQASRVEIAGSALTPQGRLFRGPQDLPVSSGLYTSTEPNSTGNGGNLILTADRISLRNGGVLQTATFSSGNAGNLIVKASDFIEVMGTDAEGLFPSSLFAASGGITKVTAGVPQATGKGGDISIETRELRVQEGAAVAVGSINPNDDAKGAGNLKIQAETIRLDSRGRLVAETASGQGGDIDLQVQDLLLLRRGSQISTSAGTAQKQGDGGNITINAKNGFIVAVPGENSDITANAFSGNGGQVNIDVAGIYGMVERDREELVKLLQPTNPSELDPTSVSTNDITAFSQTRPTFGDAITINTSYIEPTDVVPLPTNLVDASQQIATGCTPGSRQRRSSFVATGRGGIAPSPTEPLTGESVIANWITFAEQTRGQTEVGNFENESHFKGKIYVNSTNSSQINNNWFNYLSKVPDSPKIIEAQGWIVDANGDVILVAESPSVNSLSVPLSLSSCHAQ